MYRLRPASSRPRRPLGRPGRAIVRVARRILNPVGLDLVRFQPSTSFAASRLDLLNGKEINLVLDVGAHSGYYGRQLRLYGYRGRIVSFEPVAEAFSRLVEEARDDALWECKRLALGESERDAELSVSGNDLLSSSFLEMTDLMTDAEPNAAYIGSEVVKMAALDSLGPSLIGRSERVFLKIDVQGLELEVLRGAEASMRQVHAIEIELTLLPLYVGQPLLTDVVQYLHELDFDLIALEDGFRTKYGTLLQLDGLFGRRAT